MPAPTTITSYMSPDPRLSAQPDELKRRQERQNGDEHGGRICTENEEREPIHAWRRKAAAEKQDYAAHIARRVRDIDEKARIAGLPHRRDHAVEEHGVKGCISKIESS